MWAGIDDDDGDDGHDGDLLPLTHFHSMSCTHDAPDARPVYYVHKFSSRAVAAELRGRNPRTTHRQPNKCTSIQPTLAGDHIAVVGTIEHAWLSISEFNLFAFCFMRS